MVDFITIFIFLIVFYVLKNSYKKYKKHPNEIKGPTPLPIIGNILSVIFNEKHIVIDRFDKQYGGIFRFWVCDRYFVFISDVDLLKEILIDRFHEFNLRPTFVPDWGVASNNGVGLASSHGDLWYKNRSMVHKAIRKANSNNLTLLIESKVKELLNIINFHQKSGQVFYPSSYFRMYALSSMFKYLFNENISLECHGDDEKIKLGKELDLFIKKSFNNGLLNYFESIQSFYTWYLHKTDTSLKTIRNLLNSKISEHLNSIDNESPRDLLDLLINEFELKDKSDKSVSSNINQVCFDMMAAGVSSTSDTLEWTLLELINHPEHQDTLYKELKQVVGDKDSISLSDRYKTPFTNSLIKEVIRKRVMLLGLPRVVDEDKMLGKYFLPKNSIIFSSIRAIGTNEKHFKNAKQFDPTRFLGVANEAYFPFGLGQRNCPGQTMAVDEVFLCISNLYLKYKIKSTTGEKLNDDEVFSLSVVPKYRFGVLFESR